MRIKRLLWFLPSIAFALLWLHVVQGGLAIEQAVRHPIRSPQFITPMNRALDDPWLHNSALRRYFQKLERSAVPAVVWSRSEWLGYALWNQYQFAGGIEIMLVITHNQNMPQKELPWAARYAAIFPDDPLGAEWLAHARHGHREGLPLRVTGVW